ncbi:MAG: DNA polymerase I, partial [Anaerolineae bacterium]|nr:DNA polymerase I [Anaerolineae bacterium]
MTDKKETLILIDGHALAYRAYFGMPATFNTSDGEPTHAVYGFTNMLLAVWKEYDPDYFIVTFDLGDTFRHEMYGDYKATREKMPDDLNTQIDRIQKLVTAFNMPIFTKESYEADDLLGTLATQAAAKDIEALIVTGDRDAFQLVAPNIKVVISGSKFADRVLYDEAKVEDRYGVTPKQLIQLKGLVGDTSDNIPGVKGIGEKGGAKLIQEFGTLEGIYDNLDKIAKGTRAKLEADRESAFLSRELGRIITDVPGVELNIQAGKTMDFDIVEVANLFVELEFNTIFNRIPGAPPDKSPEEVATVAPKTPTGPVDPDGKYITVDTEVKLDALVGQLKQSDRLCVDVETDSTDEVQAKLVGIAITPTAGQGYYIPLAHGHKAEPQPGEQASLFDEPEWADVPEQLDLTTVQHALAPVLARPDALKYMHNAKFDMVLLQRHGMPVEPPIYDTMIAAYIGNNAPAARYGLKELVRENLNIQMTEIKELIGSGKNQLTMDQISIEQVTPYAAADVDMTLRLAGIVDKPLQEDKDFRHIFETLDLPLIYVLIDMELAGIKLDTDALRQMSHQMTRRLGELEQAVHQAAGTEFNLNSTQQLSDILFSRLGLPTQGLKKNKSGHYSTAANVLEGLQGQHEIIELIVEHRTLAKLKSTYVDALPALVNPHTGRIHTNYNQIGISTGRLSSSDPNLQNIPIRTEQGREIRRAFVAEEGHYLIAADYSQVELRILAHITEDAGLVSAFENDEDIHTATASAVLGIPQDQIDKYQRRIAKTVNFGLIYGQTAFGLAQGTGMSREEARAFIETYFEKYPGVKAYIDRTEKLAAEQGYVETLLGRKRDFSQLAGLTGAQRARAEREAINMPIQGTAADIMKQAMITLHRELASQGFKTRMLLQVHDELVLEAPEAELDQAVKLTHDVMCEAFKLRIPLKVDVEVG